MSEHDGTRISTLQRPTTNDRGAWKAYWKVLDQPWRTEQEIDEERQRFLAEQRAIKPDIQRGVYPFKNIKLTRADVEWLLVTHESGGMRGPVGWSDEKQRERWGLDLRGADLCEANLGYLPLTRLRGGLNLDEWHLTPPEHREAAVLHLEGTKLPYANLEGAELGWAHLEKALLNGTCLEGASLRLAHLEGTDLTMAYLKGANLRGTFFDIATDLDRAAFSSALVSSTHWNNTNLAVVKWSQVRTLGDEEVAWQARGQEGKKDKLTRLEEFERAVRANRRLAVVLRDHGLNEDADRFAYRAQKLQRVVLRRQRKFRSYLFSAFLDLLAGYGYRPVRTILWYLFIIVVFALAYHIFGQLSLFPPDAFVYSLTSFHGRGFFPGLQIKTSLHDPLVMLAAFEAVVGLLIEISFIATFTQRFFGK